MLVSLFLFVISIKGIKRFKRFKRAKPPSSPQGLGLNGPLGPFKPSKLINLCNIFAEQVLKQGVFTLGPSTSSMGVLLSWGSLLCMSLVRFSRPEYCVAYIDIQNWRAPMSTVGTSHFPGPGSRILSSSFHHPEKQLGSGPVDKLLIVQKEVKKTFACCVSCRQMMLSRNVIKINGIHNFVCLDCPREF